MFGRSPSVIKRILERSARFGGAKLFDLRKIPGFIKKLAAKRQQSEVIKFMGKWMDFINGKADKPP